jgi:5-histidylcysteine sulfoxide synthase/putative 4-mercaptohistidine N1-methyltranferase
LKEISIYPPTLDGGDIEKKREEIREYFHNTFTLFEKIFDVFVSDEVFYRKSEPSRHPMIFYFGHTATFFINKLLLTQIISERIDPDLEAIFAVGVDEMEWDDTNSKNYSWPEVARVRAYRDRVRTLVDELITTMDFRLPITWESPMWVILMGIEHERIHIETSLVLHRQMPLEFVQEIEAFRVCSQTDNAPHNEMLPIPASTITLGKEKNHHLYGWDNEYGTQEHTLESFELSKYLVSNGEYMEFVKAGGYEKEEYWDEEGLAFLSQSGAKHPPFWVEKEGRYLYRTLCSEIEMPLDWPVDVNALEAMAFCRYKSQREGVEYTLPSEAEYRALVEYVGLEDLLEFDDRAFNCNFAHFFSSTPVSMFMKKGFGDVSGNVWQWSRTPIRPFEGFEVHKAYDDFTVPTYDEKHAMICGASWASSGNLIMKHSRYAFRRHFYQNAGFRYAITNNHEESKIETEDIYESDALVSQYCEFQYGAEHFGVQNFALACGSLASRYANNKSKALDLGCATGRASFELAKSFDVVEGIDFSARFISVGVKLKNEGMITWNTVQEGEISEKKSIFLTDLGYEELAAKVNFWQGDACNLKPNFKGYDLIIATNLIDRLYQPRLFLEDVASRLNDEGILMITSPYTWQESSTQKEFWLGGYEEDGKEVRTLESLKEILRDEFELIAVQDLEFVIAETARKYQHTIAEVSIWKKK